MSKVKLNFQVFERSEKKYRLTEEKCQAFLEEIKPYIRADNYGMYTVQNIYYDTEHFDLIRTSIEKPSYKEKLRLRCYGTPKENTMVYIELKKKVGGVVYKRREKLTLFDAILYLNQGIRPKKNSQILREIDYFMQFYHPIPKLYLAYDRVAYAGILDSDLRITIDSGIRSREHGLDLRESILENEYLDPLGYLMEIKVPAAYPLWLSSNLSKLEIFPVSFSKYGAIYKRKQMEMDFVGAPSKKLQKARDFSAQDDRLLVSMSI